jgi:hypothetical protein
MKTTPPYWIVLCRLLFQDEDSLYIVQTDTGDAAIAEAEAKLRIESEQPREEDTEPETGDFVLNYLVRCDTKPTVNFDLVNNR